MSNSIQLVNLQDITIWQKDLPSDQFIQLKRYAKDSARTISVLPATLFPVRTNHLKNFSKDFFLPTTINHAIAIQNFVPKIFAILLSLLLDVPTFPIRLITCIPRAVFNARKAEHPLQKYFIVNGVDKKSLESGRVRVKLEWEKTSLLPTTYWTDGDGVEHSQCGREKHWIKQSVNLIQQPMYEECFESGMNS